MYEGPSPGVSPIYQDHILIISSQKDAWDWRDDSAAMRTGCSFSGPVFSSQRLYGDPKSSAMKSSGLQAYKQVRH